MTKETFTLVIDPDDGNSLIFKGEKYVPLREMENFHLSFTIFLCGFCFVVGFVLGLLY